MGEVEYAITREQWRVSNDGESSPDDIETGGRSGT